MRRLIEGVHHFQREVFPSCETMFQRLASRQDPEVCLVCCADSRVVPHLLTNNDPGEVFTIRNAGNFIPLKAAGGTRASIRYALQNLPLKDVVVMGHTNCGAVTALLNADLSTANPDDEDDIIKWLQHAREVREVMDASGIDGDDRMCAAVRANAVFQLYHLSELPWARRKLESGRFAMHAWVFDIPTGHVHAWNPETARYEDLPAEGFPVARPVTLDDLQRTVDAYKAQMTAS